MDTLFFIVLFCYFFFLLSYYVFNFVERFEGKESWLGWSNENNTWNRRRKTTTLVRFKKLNNKYCNIPLRDEDFFYSLPIWERLNFLDIEMLEHNFDIRLSGELTVMKVNVSDYNLRCNGRRFEWWTWTDWFIYFPRKKVGELSMDYGQEAILFLS